MQDIQVMLAIQWLGREPRRCIYIYIYIYILYSLFNGATRSYEEFPKLIVIDSIPIPIRGCLLDSTPKHELVGGLEHFSCFHILGISSSQLTNSIIFQRGRYTTNQMNFCGFQWQLPVVDGLLALPKTQRWGMVGTTLPNWSWKGSITAVNRRKVYELWWMVVLWVTLQ